MSNNNSEIVQGIITLLGGNRFIIMTGAKNLMSDGPALSFRLPSNFAKDGINYVKLALNADDLYDVTFGKIRGTKYTVIAEVEGVYSDSVRELFTRKTGLELSLGSMRA